jgi:hypothetical protein
MLHLLGNFVLLMKCALGLLVVLLAFLLSLCYAG